MPVKRDCEVCRGSGVVRLPLYKRTPVDVTCDPVTIASIDESSRTFPCPQCADELPSERLLILEAHAQFTIRDGERSEAMEHCKRTTAMMLADHLLASGAIRFREFPAVRPGLYEHTTELRATVGVASPQPVAAFEDRVHEGVKTSFKAVLEEAAFQINNWGSASRYVDGRIDKPKAINCVGDAIRTVLERRKGKAA